MKTFNIALLSTICLLFALACTRTEKAVEKEIKEESGSISKLEQTGVPNPPQKAPTLPGLFPQASTRSLQKVELVKMPVSYLRIMRNEIFARHGYKFRSEDMQKHFKKQDWYQPQFEKVDTKLTSLEKENIALIKRLEKLITGELAPKECFDFYQLMFPQLELPFELMTDKKSSGDGSLIPKYLNQTGHDFNLVVGKVWENEKMMALIIHEEVPNPPSFAPHQFQLFTFNPTGDIIDSLVIAYDDFDGYQAAIVEKDRFETKVFSYEFGEEEGPNGLPEVESVHQVRSEIYEIEANGKIEKISASETEEPDD